ncbi:MAG: lipopolysaccharide biosynthesis protein [Bacteroidales bacterium]|nr:lipopolysaccharide biosynthesis protein [Bacteroidales bacterium]
MAEESLKNKTLKGVGWSAADTVLRYGITFVVGIILARLLTPDQYGLIGILTIFIEVFNMIIDGGFSNALIRKTNAKEVDYSTVFITNMALSVVMAATLFFSAGLIAKFFNRPELVSLTQVMSVLIIINALAVIQRVRLTKNIDFKTQTKVSFLSGIISGVIGVGMAFGRFGVWALVGQQISNSVASILFLWIFNKWVPKLKFSFTSLKDLWGFGWKLLMSGLLNTLSGQIHHAVIGKIYSPATLGQYTRAFQFGNMFSGNLTSVIQRVTFPVLSVIQDDPDRLKSSYQRIIKLTVLPTFVLMMGLAACAKSFIYTLIGPQWEDAAVYLQIICFSMMLFPLHSLNLNAIQIMGRSDLTLRINIIKNLLMIFPILIGIFTNIYWMLIADVFRGYICYYLNAYYSGPLLHYSIKEQIKDILPSFGVAMAMAMPVFGLSFLPLHPVLILIIQVIVGTGLTLLICEKRKLSEYLELKEIVFGVVRKYKTKS